MDTEIELKFLLNQGIQQQLPHVIQELGDIQSHRTTRLLNCYFDTPERALRQHDIGLRIRTSDGRRVQTVKTAGRSDGGLHQRPEYNIEVSEQRPDLALFDAEIWPQGFPLEQVQQDLAPLFTTDFDRTIWLLADDSGTVVEVAFDEGVITSGDRQESILELEMELVSGTLEGLFRLARGITRKLPLRLSDQSKAARGYRLLNNQKLSCQKELGYVKLKGQNSVERSIIKCSSFALNFIQHHQTCFFAEPGFKALKKITDGFAFLRHTLRLFDNALPATQTRDFAEQIKQILHQLKWVEHARQLQALTSKTTKVNKKLQRRQQLLAQIERSQASLPSLDDAKGLLTSPNYCTLMLDLSEWLELRKWRQHSTEDQKQYAASGIAEHARGYLEQSWQLMIGLMKPEGEMAAEDYLTFRQHLTRSLLTGVAIGSLFDQDERGEFRRPWLDIHQGIDELENLTTLRDFIESSDLEDGSLESWLDNKINSLMLALEQSRSSALAVEPYWR